MGLRQLWFTVEVNENAESKSLVIQKRGRTKSKRESVGPLYPVTISLFLMQLLWQLSRLSIRLCMSRTAVWSSDVIQCPEAIDCLQRCRASGGRLECFIPRRTPHFLPYVASRRVQPHIKSERFLRVARSLLFAYTTHLKFGSDTGFLLVV